MEKMYRIILLERKGKKRPVAKQPPQDVGERHSETFGLEREKNRLRIEVVAVRLF